MEQMINMTNSPDDTERFADEQDYLELCRKYGCDGYEYMHFEGMGEPPIPHDRIKGVHLCCFDNWMDLWLGRKDRVLEEYGNWKMVEQTFGGRSPKAILDTLQRNLDYAEKVQAEYVVFHVSDVKIREAISGRFDYSNKEVIQAACDMINQLLDGKKYSFTFLMENLWWSGFTFTNPEETRLLLNSVHYPNRGIMLDIGHLMHTNLELTSQSEAISYIEYLLDRHGELCKWIRGVHLHQSITGDRIRSMWKKNTQLADDYYERWCQIFQFIFEIDQHKPFSEGKITELIRRIHPQWLTHEFISRSREELEEYLEQQTAFHFS